MKHRLPKAKSSTSRIENDSGMEQPELLIDERKPEPPPASGPARRGPPPLPVTLPPKTPVNVISTSDSGASGRPDPAAVTEGPPKNPAVPEDDSYGFLVDAPPLEAKPNGDAAPAEFKSRRVTPPPLPVKTSRATPPPLPARKPPPLPAPAEVKRVFTAPEPVVTNQEPSKTAPPLVVSADKPVTSDTPPVISEPKPITPDIAPVVNESKPLTSDTAPVLIEEKPVGSGIAPVVNESKPLTSDTAPVFIEEKPVGSGIAPVVNEPKPLTSDTAPVVIEEKPDDAVSYRRWEPSVVLEPPEVSPDKPASSGPPPLLTPRPAVSDEVPAEHAPFLIQTQGLVKQYGGRRVVNGVDIHVRAGEVVGLLGKNGAGKTTTFYMIVGLVPPTLGHVFMGDEDVTHMPMYRRARRGIGYLPQEESIFRKLTVEENLLAILETLPMTEDEREIRCDELLKDFGLEHVRENVAITLSGGEKRRVTIARALVTSPSLLLLDEPFSGVDPMAVHDIQEIILHLKERGLGVLITDHNVRETLSVVDRAYIIDEGRVLSEGTREFLLNDPIAREIYLGHRFSM